MHENSQTDVHETDLNAVSVALKATRVTMDGLTYLQHVISGEIPQSPFNDLIGIRLVHAEAGRVELAVDLRADHFNKIGTGHGGFVSTLCDNACGMAVDSVSPAGAAWTSLDLQVRFLKAITPATSPLKIVGTVIRAGCKVSVSQAEIFSAGGDLLATGTSSLYALPSKGTETS
ncbi:PaaI family thioesterase [Neomicrococcus lactis]